MNLFDDCNPVDCALEAIDSIGLNIAEIGLLTRVWDGGKLGKGNVKDSLNLFSPTPRIDQIRQRHHNKEAGQERRGDLLIKLLSKSKYPTVDMIDATTNEDSEEIYYYVNGDLYEVVEVLERITHWDVLVSKSKKRKLYLDEID